MEGGVLEAIVRSGETRLERAEEGDLATTGDELGTM
jgi:hypothetical protein